MHRCMHGCILGCMNGCIHGYMHGCMHCMDTCMDASLWKLPRIDPSFSPPCIFQVFRFFFTLDIYTFQRSWRSASNEKQLFEPCSLPVVSSTADISRKKDKKYFLNLHYGLQSPTRKVASRNVLGVVWTWFSKDFLMRFFKVVQPCFGGGNF